MSPSIFLQEAGHLLPTELARGPWNPEALHGGAPAALITDAFERHEPTAGLAIARLGFELLRPIPFAPLRLEVRTVRAGRRVQELAAELHAEPDGGEGALICRATALRVVGVPEGLGRLPAGALAEDSMPGPAAGTPVRFSLDDSAEAGFGADAMEVRRLEPVGVPGPARIWMRLRPELTPGRPAGPLARLAATADFGNGVSASLPFADYTFINADLTIHLQRPPQGDWIGLDSRTLLHEGGTALAESVLHDTRGPVGRAFQALVVAPR